MPDPFTTLGLPPRYDLDLALAEKRHRELSRTLHPDRFVGRPGAERRQALGKAIEVNEAWRALRDPVRRAEALLSLLGRGAGSGSPADEREPTPPPEFLMEVMEQREELAQARGSRDLASLSRLELAMKARQAELVGELGRALGSLAAESTPEHRESALRKLGELRYCRRFLEEAAEAEEILSGDP